jgi:hypothetical protein
VCEKVSEGIIFCLYFVESERWQQRKRGKRVRRMRMDLRNIMKIYV